GKKVGMASGTSSETILELALKDADMSKDDLELVDMDASAVVTAMTSGGVDAAATWSPNTNTIKEELGDDAIKLAENADYAEEFPSIASWVVAPSYARCEDRKSTRLNSSHVSISYAVFCLKKKNTPQRILSP